MLHGMGNVQVFTKKERRRQKIVEMRQYDAEKAGVDRKNFPQIKERIQKNGEINFKTKAAKRLCKNF